MKLKDGTTIKPEDVEAKMLEGIDELLDASTYSSPDERDYVEAYMREVIKQAAYYVRQSGGIQ